MDLGTPLNLAEIADALLKRAGFKLHSEGKRPSELTGLENSGTEGYVGKVAFRDLGAAFLFEDGSVLWLFDRYEDEGKYCADDVACPDMPSAAARAAEADGDESRSFESRVREYERVMTRSKDAMIRSKNMLS